MKTICLCISKEVEDWVDYSHLEDYFPLTDKALKDEGWQLDDLQIL